MENSLKVLFSPWKVENTSEENFKNPISLVGPPEEISRGANAVCNELRKICQQLM